MVIISCISCYLVLLFNKLSFFFTHSTSLKIVGGRNLYFVKQSNAMDISPADCDPLIQTGDQDATGTQRKDELAIVVYKRRWYILMIFSLISTTQGFVWSTWGPIATSANDAFGWTDADIALLAIWGPVCYILGAPLFSWLQNSKGLRWATVLEGGLVTAGAGLRCISSSPPLVT